MLDPVPCPGCGSPLRLPDNSRGKTVRCPRCATTFVAGEPAAPSPEAIQPAPSARPPQGPLPRPEQVPDFHRRKEDRVRLPTEESERAIKEVASTIIPYKNGPALAAYYCGVFSIICG